jgi:hypothetical protein
MDFRNAPKPQPMLELFTKLKASCKMSLLEYDLFHLETSPFVHFMVQILSHRSNSVYTVMFFKILNDVTVYTLLDL